MIIYVYFGDDPLIFFVLSPLPREKDSKFIVVIWLEFHSTIFLFEFGSFHFPPSHVTREKQKQVLMDPIYKNIFVFYLCLTQVQKKGRKR